MANQRTEAEALAACLEYGLADVSEAVQWADRQIAQSDLPHTSLCDVSMAARANNLDVAAMLRRLPGAVDASFVTRRVIERAAQCLRSSPEKAGYIAAALHQMARDETLPPGPLRRNAWWFYDAIDLATSRIIEDTPQEIIRQMADALDAHLAVQYGDE